MKTENQSATENKEQWHLLVETANGLFAEGLYEKAEVILQDVLNMPDLVSCCNFKAATILNNLGMLYYTKKSYQKAEEYYKKAYDIWQNNFDKEYMPFAILLNNMAVMYYITNRFDMAETACIKALDIKQKLVGENSLDCAELLNVLALIYYAKGDIGKSKELSEQELDIRKQYPDKNHLLTQSVNDSPCEIKNLPKNSLSTETDEPDKDSLGTTVEREDKTQDKSKKTDSKKIKKETKSSKNEERPSVKRGRPTLKSNSGEKKRWKKEK